MKKKVIKINTEKTFTSLNSYIEEFLSETNEDGIIHIFTKHTTCSIRILENELLLLADINNYLSSQFPQEYIYLHDQIGLRQVPNNERVNGYSHLRQLFLGTSETVPISKGQLEIGKWQTIFLIELDPKREREIVLTLLT